MRLRDRRLDLTGEILALAAVIANHYASQLVRLDEVAGQFGEGPKVRRRRRCLEGGDLLGTDSPAGLTHDAGQDREAATEQERLRENYLRRRSGRPRGSASHFCGAGVLSELPAAGVETT